MIHKFQIGDLYLVLDVNSGAIHSVSAVLYKALEGYPNPDIERIKNNLIDEYSQEDIDGAIEAIEDLITKGQLFTEDSQIDAFRLSRTNPVIKALCLHVAHDCNIRCAYCFAAQGSFEGCRTLMSYETGVKALDFLVAHSGNRKHLEVDFFGGEPLMNFDVVKKLVEYGRTLEKEHNKIIRFTMTTNGVLLDQEKIDYINKEMYNLVLSLDGRTETNDQMRKTISGEGTYDVIVPKLQQAVNERNGKSYYVRGTFTRNNLDFSKDVLHLADLGFDQVSVEPVVAPKDQPYALRDEDVEELCKEYEQLANDMVKRQAEGNGFNFFHFQIDLNRGPCVIKRVLGCGAGAEYLAITPEGEIYPCHQFVGNETFKIGHVDDGTISNKEIISKFSNASVYDKESCKKCWAKFYCSGGCHANAWHENGNLLEPYKIGCLLEMKRIECAIYLQAKQLVEENV